MSETWCDKCLKYHEMNTAGTCPLSEANDIVGCPRCGQPISGIYTAKDVREAFVAGHLANGRTGITWAAYIREKRRRWAEAEALRLWPGEGENP